MSSLKERRKIKILKVVKNPKLNYVGNPTLGSGNGGFWFSPRISTRESRKVTKGAAVGGGNQHVEEKDQVEDITALTAPPVSATEVMVPNATPVASTVGKETLDGCHVAKITPPNPPMTFHVVSRAPLAPPLALEFMSGGLLSTPRALEFQPGGPRALGVAETGEHVGVIPAPSTHEVQVAPSRAPFLATNRADRIERRKKKNKEAKLKKRKDRE